MHYLKSIGILFLLSCCQTHVSEHPAMGTWSNCTKDGIYWECKITDRSLLMVNTFSDEVWFFKLQVVDTNLVLSTYKNGPGLLINNDTLVTIEQSTNRIVLKSTYSWDSVELKKKELDFDPIDTLHFENWKSKVLADFKKRAALVNCPDTRTEEEKKLPILKADDSDEEIEITVTDSLGNRRRFYLTEEENILPMLEADDSDEEIQIIEIDSLGNRKCLDLNDF
ncbi:hypothetical protein ACFO3O_18710 [Dokdonia ponticola]|uniref:Uncharacterized protein n=1 Tax=Dokdonia ponticola TaxID=2041041 RepID=A0ABV9I2M3_9FLAO